MGGRRPVAGNYITKVRVSFKKYIDAEDITVLTTSVAAKGEPVERSRRSSTMPFSGGEAAAQNRCGGHKG
jgi:hypothetical protein